MSQSIRRGGCLVLGAVLAAACGNGDDLDPNAARDGTFPAADIRPGEVTPLPADDGSQANPLRPASAPGVDDEGDSTGDGDPGQLDPGALDPGALDPGAVDPATANPGPAPPPVDPNVCAVPLGVSGTPRTLSEAITLMNSLPRPTTLACFLQSLSRPLDVYMTRSDDSLQPSPGARSPRTFIVFEPLVLSIVFEGPAHVALELGYRTTPTRSIKTEIVFPLTTDVTPANLFDKVMAGEEATRCGACHIGEVQTVHPDLPVDVFESDILTPFDFEEVDVESLRAERQSCNPTLEPERCTMLSAFFDFGTIQPAPGGILFSP
jgi:hypothetical protein